MFNRLVEFETGTTNIVPGAGRESWTVSPDGKVYTFKLRKGVKFHSNAKFTPTRDFNADDVLFSWNRMADDEPSVPQDDAGPDVRVLRGHGHEEHRRQGREGRPDDGALHAEEPEAPFLADMAMDFASILSAGVLRDDDEEGHAQRRRRVSDRHRPVRVRLATRRTRSIRYKAFDQYWGGRPKIDNLVFAITRDAIGRYAKLKTGECHVMAFPKPADLDEMKKDPNINLVQQKQGLNVGYIAFNVEKKPFDNKLVRQALNMATNKEAILKAVYQGAGPGREEPDPADALELQQRGAGLPVRPGQGEAAARAGRLSERPRASSSGTCR